MDEYFGEEGFSEMSIENSNVQVKDLSSKEIDKLRKLGVKPVVPYFKEYETEKRVMIKGDKKIIIPSHKIYEQGVRVE